MSVSRRTIKRTGFVVTVRHNGAPLGRVHGSHAPSGVLRVRKTAEIFPDIGEVNGAINATIEHHLRMGEAGDVFTTVTEFRVTPVGTWT